ncbi:MAG TPA: 4Fe-4S binding protein [Candidatus Lokiarchaeia archaeon]|nr:4Fe-4S binding protein [Candidatus Lokiarchaeia archaeon]
MGLKRLLWRVITKITQYPSIGRIFSTLFGALETPFLDTLYFIDSHFAPGFFDKMWFYFTRLYGTRVLPINQALTAGNYIAPTEEILEIIRRQPALSMGWCYCRRRGGVPLDDPWIWTCIHVGTAQSLKQLAKYKPLKSAKVAEVENLVRRAQEKGLVHQLVTAPTKDYVYVICNCDPKYCVMLSNLTRLRMPNVVESNFVAEQDDNGCQNCGTCEGRCYFGARVMRDGKLMFDPRLCYGCGLCVTTCPTGAIRLQRRERYTPKPNIPRKSQANKTPIKVTIASDAIITEQ